MAETDVFPIDPDYSVLEQWDEGVLRAFSLSRRDFQRLVAPPRRLFTLVFRGRDTTEKEKMLDWYRRFEANFFRFDHKTYIIEAGAYRTRSFPVVWAGPPAKEFVSNDAWDMQVQLVEAPGRPLPAANYPNVAGGDPSIFQEETATTKDQGTWTVTAHADARGGQEKQNANTNTTDFVIFTYGGYGFRIWARKGPALGIFEVLLDDASLGNVDLFAAAATAAAAVFTKNDVNLGLHRVKIRATNTKNASSTANTIVADALEILI